MFRNANAILFQQLLQNPSTEAAMVFRKFFVYCLNLFFLVCRAADSVPPPIVIAGAWNL